MYNILDTVGFMFENSYKVNTFIELHNSDAYEFNFANIYILKFRKSSIINPIGFC